MGITTIIAIETVIAAPVDVCFDMARDIDLHIETFSHTQERAVAGRTSGLIGMGESVTWRARHFGVVWSMTVEIVYYDRPWWFRDRMVRGPFQVFFHDHYFEAQVDGTTAMRDVVDYCSPMGLVGYVVDRLVLRRYLAALVRKRSRAIKENAERAGIATVWPRHDSDAETL